MEDGGTSLLKLPTLPEKYLEPMLGDAPLGVDVFITPWSLHVDQDLHCWLDRQNSYYSAPAGTVEMCVRRHEEGFEVWLPPANWRGYRWQFMDPARRSVLAPVVMIHNGFASRGSSRQPS